MKAGAVSRLLSVSLSSAAEVNSADSVGRTLGVVDRPGAREHHGELSPLEMQRAGLVEALNPKP